MKGFDVSTWYGLFGPKGMPQPVVAKINTEVNKLLGMKEVQEAIQAQGAEPQAMSVADFDKFFQTDFKNSKALVEASGATIQ